MRNRILYQDVAASLKRDILADRYPLGSLIPTENELMAVYEVSKITIRQAEELLVEEGYLEKRSGVGTKVISNNLFNKLSKAESFTTILNGEGKQVTKRILNIDTVAASELPFATNTLQHRVTRVQRMYDLDSKPYIYFTHYLPFTDQTVPFQQLESKPLYRLLRDLGCEVEVFKDSIAAMRLDAAMQALFQTDQALGLHRVRQSFDHDRQLIEYSDAVYLTALNPYQINYEV